LKFHISLGTRDWDCRFYPRPTSVAARCGRVVWADDSCRSPIELGDSEQVVAGGDEVGVHLHPLTTAIAGATQPADGLHPAEGFFDPLADPLADGVTGMAHGAGVDRRATWARQVLRHVRGDLERAAGLDEVAGVVALVAAQRDPLAAGQGFADHRNRRAPLGISVSRLNLEVDQDSGKPTRVVLEYSSERRRLESVTVLHQRVSRVAELGLLARALFRQPGFGIGRRLVGRVLAPLAVEVHAWIA